MKKYYLFLFVLLFAQRNFAQTLPLPPRAANALSGSQFATVIWSLTREEREEQIFSQIISGNVPNFMRQLVSVTAISGSNTATYFVIPEYLAVGSDSNYFLMPMTPILAQRICSAIHCVLPTKKMVDQIYSSSPCKLRPQPIPPSGQMITVPVFYQHNDSVKSLRLPALNQYPLGSLVGGTKKDVIISNRIYSNLNPNVPKPVVIYGWHQLNGQPIQPVYNGHGETYADYSHGIRLVLDSIIVNGAAKTYSQILSDPSLNILLSDEGTILKPYYTIAQSQTPKPKNFCAYRIGSNLIIKSLAVSGTTFKAFIGKDGIDFSDSTSSFADSIAVSGLQTDSLFFFRLQANSSLGLSEFSETLAAVPTSQPHKVLIINSFDRATTGNTYNFIRQHGKAFHQNGFAFSSATNDAVIQGLISLNDFEIVDFILGEESTADETFNSTEQELVKSFLRNGGKLFLSGAEIAWDLDYKGSAGDKDFIYNFLKTKYVNDSPGGQVGVYYQVSSVAGSFFSGMNSFYFDNGANGTYNVRYPDVIAGTNGGTDALQYSQVTNQNAATYFTGMFSGGTTAGRVVCVGFPFETIYPEQTRKIFLEKALQYFSSPINVDESDLVVENFKLYQNYPNPFNPGTVISYQLSAFSNVVLKIYDVLGNEVTTLVNEEKESGVYNYQFSILNYQLPSGVYFYRLKVGDFIQTKKMILLR